MIQRLANWFLALRNGKSLAFVVLPRILTWHTFNVESVRTGFIWNASKISKRIRPTYARSATTTTAMKLPILEFI